MSSQQKSGFRIGDWVVHPQENRLTGPGGDRTLEPRVMDLLVYLAERQGQVVSRQALLDSVWAGTVVGDETLSRAVSLLRTELGDDPRDPRYLKTVSKRGYCCIADITRLGPSDSRPPVENPVEPRTARYRWVATLLVITIALASVFVVRFVWNREAGSPGVSATRAAIAVLPFANRSAAEADAFFVDGIHDELISRIAQIGSIKTISATSVRQYRDTEKPMREIAAELGVTTVLEGGIQRVGEQVRINVQLIDARTDAHIWAEIYDRQLTAENLFAIQSEIATAIARELKATLSAAERGRLKGVPTQNLAALEAYFLGRQNFDLHTTAGLARAVDHFREALRLDPGFALAHVGLADTYRLQASPGAKSVPEADAESWAAAKQALELDDQLGEAYASLANVLRRSGGDFDGAEAAFRRALELSPNYPWAYVWYGEFLAGQIGRTDEAVVYSSRGVELDPLSPIINILHARTLHAAGRFDEAQAFYQRALDIDPNFAVAHAQNAFFAWHVQGRLDATVNLLRKAIALDPGNVYLPAHLGLAYLDLGDAAHAGEWIERAVARAPELQFTRSAKTRLHLYRNEVALALEESERTVSIYARSRYAQPILAKADLEAGRGETARLRFERAYPDLATAEPVISAVNFESAVDFAWLLSRIGEPERAETLRQRVLEFIRTKPRLGRRGYWVTDAKIHAQRGHADLALGALQQAFDEGWRTYWWYYLDHDASFDTLRELPRFRSLRDAIATDMKMQRDHLETSTGTADP